MIPGRTGGDLSWTEEAGETCGFLHRLSDGLLLEDPSAILEAMRRLRDTQRHCEIPRPTLAAIRARIEKQIKNTWLTRMQAQVGVKPILNAWMERN